MPALPLLPPEIASQLTTGADLADRERGNRRPATLPTRVPALDRLLGGGLPRGSLVEMSGRASCGRFSAALSALAAVTQTGEAAALVDPGDHFDPQGAADAGVDLPRLLWLRPRALKTALSACETVLSTGFALVVLDLGLARVSRRRFDDAVWLRLARRARFHETALLVLSPYRVTGTAAHVVLSAGSVLASWDVRQAAMPLLMGFQARVFLEKTRAHGAEGRGRETHAPLRLQLLDAVNAGRTEENEEKKKIFLERDETREENAVAVAAGAFTF
ncbi:MAG TPA: hypothetical protein VGM13_05235 [Thermoanaerobaculia bacterium]